MICQDVHVALMLEPLHRNMAYLIITSHYSTIIDVAGV